MRKMKFSLWRQITSAGAVLVLVLGSCLVLSAPVLADTTTITLTLVDDAGNPLAEYPSDYPAEQRNLTYKYRYGGTWALEVPFQTDAEGKFVVNIDPAHVDKWDKKVTVRLNQTSKEQDVTVNPVFQAARVNVNLKTCDGPIADVPGGAVHQSGGYWHKHGDTGPSGTVTFYTFPGSIKVRMTYNCASQTIDSIVIVAGTNEVGFLTTAVTLIHDDDIRSNTGGVCGWWIFSKPTMNLLPGEYDFWFKKDGKWGDPITITVSGCEMSYPSDVNQPQTIGVHHGQVTVDEGQTAINNGTYSDPDGDAVTLGASVGGVTGNSDGTWSWSFYATDGPAQTQTVTITATDGINDPVTVTFELIVNNVAPAVGLIAAPVDPVRVNTLLEVSAGFTDPGILDTHTAVWDWGDGSTCDGTVSGENGSGTVTGSHTYTAAGIYTVTLTVTDKDGDTGTSTFEYVVVYDPSGGFVTGGGWITSPAGAYAPDPQMEGRATFGFISRYRPGRTTPDGNTQFQFRAARLNFHSTEYEWLVVGGHRAQYKGSGTINGEGDYGFMLTAIDGNLTDSQAYDSFRIKIWDKTSGDIVYDNQTGKSDSGDDATQLGGGSIVIHSGAKK